MNDKEKAMMAAQSGRQQPQIKPETVKNGKTLTCSCGGMIFKSGVVIKKISAILSPTGLELDIPIQILYCKDCGKVHPDTDPENVLPETLKSSKLNIKIN